VIQAVYFGHTHFYDFNFLNLFVLKERRNQFYVLNDQ